MCLVQVLSLFMCWGFSCTKYMYLVHVLGTCAGYFHVLRTCAWYRHGYICHLPSVATPVQHISRRAVCLALPVGRGRGDAQTPAEGLLARYALG